MIQKAESARQYFKSTNNSKVAKKPLKWKKITRFTIPSTCFAVSLSFGSGSNICRTRFFAFSETLGHGSRLKSISPRRIAWATPCSVSAIQTLYSSSQKAILHANVKKEIRGHSNEEQEAPRGKLCCKFANMKNGHRHIIIQTHQHRKFLKKQNKMPQKSFINQYVLLAYIDRLC